MREPGWPEFKQSNNCQICTYQGQGRQSSWPPACTQLCVHAPCIQDHDHGGQQIFRSHAVWCSTAIALQTTEVQQNVVLLEMQRGKRELGITGHCRGPAAKPLEPAVRLRTLVPWSFMKKHAWWSHKSETTCASHSESSALWTHNHE